ncbi:ATP-binding cassette domain-containing protein [Qingshengfaniella alkalisoli]|uniref:ATP-binding cassette domain-containing protein n=1 Tax=Qingshengfaniella alkalisoli TaxID=2599296 RepID=A0A5B8I7K7_9RHOB|nr:ATP-binding cassette domain-containing protein [Qingshengfaniella alkalisoli]QDY69549.1 ATP-binding cassette domain-containing protein [Qingshengfaniella alkalisoli]
MRDLIDDDLATAEVASLPPPLLEARGLSYAVYRKPIIHNLDLRVEPNRRLVILGANGSGKTTLLRLLHGLILPSSGHIETNTLHPNAMVFQKPTLLRRSVRANLDFALKAYGVARTARRQSVTDALACARLQEKADQPARSLSGGEQQRLACARALACRPSILFLDEPTASLDPASTQMIEAQLEAATADGVTLVLVTHDAGQARRMADDIIFLHAGRIVERQSAVDFFNTPRSASAQAWLAGELYVDP